jgi:hypothetical protein
MPAVQARHCILVLVFALTACPRTVSAQATPHWGTQTVVSITDVGSGGGESNPSTDLKGGAGAFLAGSSANDLRGTGDAAATLQAVQNKVPILRSRSVLSGGVSGAPGVTGARVTAGAFASEMFRYNGSVPTTLSLTFTLEGTVSDLPADSLTRITSEVAIFNAANYAFSSSFDTLVFEMGATTKAFDRTTLRILDDTGGSLATRTTVLTFQVIPGEIFYLWETMETSARRDMRSSDAFNTMIAEFDRPELVTPGSVPEPGVLAYLLAASCLIATVRRFRLPGSRPQASGWHQRRQP